MSEKIVRCASCEQRRPKNEMSKFPSNRDAALKWVNEFGIDPKDFKPNSYVCHIHFDTIGDFTHYTDEFGNQKKKIKPKATPKYHLPMVSQVLSLSGTATF